MFAATMLQNSSKCPFPTFGHVLRQNKFSIIRSA